MNELLDQLFSNFKKNVELEPNGSPTVEIRRVGEEYWECKGKYCDGEKTFSYKKIPIVKQ